MLFHRRPYIVYMLRVRRRRWWWWRCVFECVWARRVCVCVCVWMRELVSESVRVCYCIFRVVVVTRVIKIIFFLRDVRNSFLRKWHKNVTAPTPRVTAKIAISVKNTRYSARHMYILRFQCLHNFRLKNEKTKFILPGIIVYVGISV